MNSVPIRNGKSCVFRVVHVAGTMRRAEEEAIRRARDLIFAAQNGQKEGASDPLSNMFGTSERPQPEAATEDSLSDSLDVEDEDIDIEMGEITDD